MVVKNFFRFKGARIMLDAAWDVVSESRAAAAPVGWIAPNSIPSMVKMRVKTLDSTIHSALIIGRLTWNAASGELLEHCGLMQIWLYMLRSFFQSTGSQYPYLNPQCDHCGENHHNVISISNSRELFAQLWDWSPKRLAQRYFRRELLRGVLPANRQAWRHFAAFRETGVSWTTSRHRDSGGSPGEGSLWSSDYRPAAEWLAGSDGEAADRWMRGWCLSGNRESCPQTDARL